jgi:hypothetical protein
MVRAQSWQVLRQRSAPPLAGRDTSAADRIACEISSAHGQRDGCSLAHVNDNQGHQARADALRPIPWCRSLCSFQSEDPLRSSFSLTNSPDQFWTNVVGKGREWNDDCNTLVKSTLIKAIPPKIVVRPETTMKKLSTRIPDSQR